ncbi:uncharacterized protein EI90DRAFT_374335 [Cantharellus anzutake]|uniref:uncharacterized protein n=1 Tax=Cantharellus anzutake TaxID=1750568 RepID=UPI0019039953|nr:uncharacterized protein EI90DRAFT_374335 [Cantharellus anzutake]KAF8334904.1 hypothetical protein EI90DRAFT_374335 [Cantharellus anzutake]
MSDYACFPCRVDHRCENLTPFPTQSPLTARTFVTSSSMPTDFQGGRGVWDLSQERLGMSRIWRGSPRMVQGSSVDRLGEERSYAPDSLACKNLCEGNGRAYVSV